MNNKENHVTATLSIEAKCLFVAGIVIGVFGLKRKNIECIDCKRVDEDDSLWDVRIRLQFVWASTLPILIAREVCYEHPWYQWVNIIGNDVVIRVKDCGPNE